MWHWNGETLTQGPVVEAPELPQLPAKMRNAPGAAGQVRGMVGAEALEIAVTHAFEQMARAVVAALADAPDDAVLVIGGIPDAALALQRALPPALARRSVLQTLDVHATPAVIADVVRSAAAKAHADEVLGLEQELFEDARGRGRAAVGRKEVLQALREQAVRALFVTPSVAFEALPEDEAAVHAALAQGAEVVVTPDHGDRIDLSSDGLAALLRFVQAVGTPPA
jgi:peptide subunit release factor 1 (eRF1)